MNWPAIAEPAEEPIEFIATHPRHAFGQAEGGTKCSMSWLPLIHVGAWHTPMIR